MIYVHFQKTLYIYIYIYISPSLTNSLASVEYTLTSDCVLFRLQTPGVVGGARSRSPGVGAEVTSELSHYPLLDTSSTGWNEDNTRDEVNVCK